MRLQKWRVVILRDRILRQARTNLRVILNLAIHSELAYLGQLRSVYREKRLIGKLVPSQRRREGVIVGRSNDLLQALSHSILRCGKGSACISIEENKLSPDIATLAEDMVWNSLEKKWFCINCYTFYYGTEAQMSYTEDLFKRKKEELRSFDEWFSDFVSRK